jgi:hypothetical protein
LINYLLFIFVQVSAASISSRLTYDKDDVDEVNEGADYELINDMKLQKIEKEFKRSFGNLILSLLSPILVILAIIGLKAVINLYIKYNFYKDYY